MPLTRTRSFKELRKNQKRDTVAVYLRLKPHKTEQTTLVKVGDQEVKTIPTDDSNGKIYSFTQVFENASQSEMFNKVARPVVEDFIQKGKDGLIFTYGITGSGKTFTMEGLKSDPGLIYRTIDFIFNSIGSQQTQQSIIQNHRDNTYQILYQDSIYPALARSEMPPATPSIAKWRNRTKETSNVSVDPQKYFCVFISLIELYNKQVTDLFEDLDPNQNDKEKRRRDIRTDARGMTYVANATEIEIKSADEAVELYTRGVRRRRVGSTALNQESSRGHLVLNFKLVQVEKSKYQEKFEPQSLIVSQLSLVDLAGSERAKRSGATGGTLHEACSINNSLGALRKCIRALRDPQSATNIQFREYSLTRLFKSYFEGHGTVCMVLCVNPTPEDFSENSMAMDFGILTQDVVIDYATPAKMIKRTKTTIQDSAMYEYFDDKKKFEESLADLSVGDFIQSVIQRLTKRREQRKKLMEAAYGAQAEFRETLVKLLDDREAIKSNYETQSRKFAVLNSRLDSIEKSEVYLKYLSETLAHESTGKQKEIEKLSLHKSNLEMENEKLRRALANTKIFEQSEKQLRKTILPLMKKSTEWFQAAPSAPEMEPMQTSSPMETSPSPQSTSSTEINTSDHQTAPILHTQEHANLLTSPRVGVPVINPRDNRSLSTSNIQWIHHKPTGTLDTATVFKPKFKNGKSVRKLRSSDILHKDASNYSIVHQDADSNGDIETSIYKGDILPTVCGGKQVIINDIERMRQTSPKLRRRAASDAHFTH